MIEKIYKQYENYLKGERAISAGIYHSFYIFLEIEIVYCIIVCLSSVCSIVILRFGSVSMIVFRNSWHSIKMQSPVRQILRSNDIRNLLLVLSKLMFVTKEGKSYNDSIMASIVSSTYVVSSALLRFSKLSVIFFVISFITIVF